MSLLTESVSTIGRFLKSNELAMFDHHEHQCLVFKTTKSIVRAFVVSESGTVIMDIKINLKRYLKHFKYHPITVEFTILNTELDLKVNGNQYYKEHYEFELKLIQKEYDQYQSQNAFNFNKFYESLERVPRPKNKHLTLIK